MSCGCTDPCQPNSIPCTCEARVTSDCVTVSGATSNCLAIDDNLLLTDYLTQMDERICEKVDSVTNFIALENVGTGSELYKGDSLLGKKQIRTVKSLDSALIVTETVDEIQLDLNLPAIIPPDGTETKLVSGTNTTVTGLGTTTSPYVVNSTDTVADGSETKINAGTNVTITGNGTVATPYVVNSTNTTYTAGNGINLTGTVFSLDNLQKVITTSTVILDIDNNNTIFINNGATPITITVNSSITLPNFCVGFIQEGTGDVTFVGTGVSLTNPVGLKSKGQGYQTFIERKLATSTYYLLGNTKF